jgi:YidC/Oxa1 family membrane protein insertase
LPLLIQFPVLIGLYRAIIILLGSTPQALFELTERVYGQVDSLVGVASALPIANRFLWLNLAQPDPWFILPVLIFVTMFVQQKLLSPAARKSKDDGKDKKKQQEDSPMAGMTQSMQYTMPVMFAFFSLSFPSGLSLYWILANVIGIGQGYITRVSMKKERAAAESRGIPPTTGIPEPEAEVPPSSRNGQPKPKKRASKRRKRRSAKR